MGYNVTCEPITGLDGEMQVIIVIEATDGSPLGVREMVKSLAGFLKHTIEENKISFDDVAWKPNDKVTKK